ncbi:MAG: hypothetical protein IKM61_04415 [Eubacteriaceae bacterium]|nr:hypothetical protein [Eubacteriaceae bacterium]
MNKKEFRKELLRGKGSCYYAVSKAPEKYRDMILWACRNNFSYDTQSEGTRAWFVYTLVGCDDDTTPFINAAAEALRNCSSYGNWKADYLSELLLYFASDGSEAARDAVREKYDELYKMLLMRERFPDGVFNERDFFSRLCECMADDKYSFLEIANDIGRLYRNNSLYDGYYFDWLYVTMGKKYIRTLKKLAEKSEDIAWYVKKSEEYEAEEQRRRAEWKSSGKFKRRTPEEIKEEFLNEYDLDTLDDTVKSVPVKLRGEHDWHGVHMDVLKMESLGLKAPVASLYHIYDSTYCSCCREHALRQLGKRRKLSNEILQECLYDCNEDIRSYAKKLIGRRENIRGDINEK